MPNSCWKILLCDDDDDVIQLLQHALKGIRFLDRSVETITCHSEREALEYLKKDRDIHLFYVDIRMEHEDSGFRILHFVRDIMGLSDARFIIITADILDKAAHKVLHDFEINEILIKAKMNPLSIYSSAITSLRAFHGIEEIKNLQDRLEEQLSSFSKFVPELMMPDDIWDKDHQLYLGKSKEQVMGVLFCDIRNFVTLTEYFTSSECFDFINSYLKTIIPTIIDHGGTVYQILGDGVLALFPPSEDNKSDPGLDAAISIQMAVKNYNMGRRRAGYDEISVGVGLDYGSVALGVSGVSTQMAASAFGRTINLASRLQDLTKHFEAEILISNNMLAHLSDRDSYEIRPIGHLSLKGFSDKEFVFECFDSNEEDQKIEKREHQSDLQKGLDCLKKQQRKEAHLIMTALLINAKKDTLPRQILRYLDDPQSPYY